MAFYELPIVDDNAKASEESVLAVRNYFCQKNGFISREENPDYGCDLDVELIINNIEASSKKFPIQIKSSSTVQFIKVDETDYLTKSFKTSRLTYLCQRTPAYGLIIVYNETEKNCYYDFVELIVKRITTERNDAEWEKQDNVNIHIPKANILNLDAVKSIHERFMNRFQAQDLLIRRHGEHFEIPNFPSSTNKKENIASLPASEILKKYGLLFINSAEILTLYQLLNEVSLQVTLASKELIFIASVVYGEIGKCIEADLYLTKAAQISEQFDEQEKEILQFTRIKVDFLLGKRNEQAFFEDLKKMTAVTKSKFNALQLKINLVYYAIISQIETRQLDDKLENDIMEVFDVIDKTDIEAEKKMFLKVFHADNLHMYISARMLHWITRLRVKESLKVYVSQRERNWMFNKSNSLIHTATAQVLEARNFSKTEKNKLLQAHAEYALARFFLVKEFDLLLLSFKEEKPEKEEDFKMSFLFAVNSHNLFLELGLLRDARLSLICAYDLHRLALLYYNIDISRNTVSEEVMINNLRASEIEMGLKSAYISMVDAAYDSYKKNVEAGHDRSSEIMTDEKIEKFAQTLLEVYELPKERLINITDELKAFRFFTVNGNTTDYELLTDLSHYRSKTTLYAFPSSFVIRSKRSGMESLPSIDLEKLLTEFGALK